MSTTNRWQDQAACQDMPSELFFGTPDKFGVDRHDPIVLAAARRVCNGCEVRTECLDAALDGGDDVHGVWGGATKREREALRRHIRRAKCPVCFGINLATTTDEALQCCLDCGQSWTTMRPSTQTRLNADAA